MTEILLWATGLVVAWSMATAYLRNRDPFHPLMYLGPMLLYVYFFGAIMHYYRGSLAKYIPDGAALNSALGYTLLGISAFCGGCLRPRIPVTATRILRVPMKLDLSLRRRLATAGYTLAALGLAMYFYRLMLRGGLFAAYSAPKGGVARAASGYVGGIPLLTIPAIMLFLISRHPARHTWKTFALVLLFALPLLIQGLLGGSRGPMFLTLASLAFGWYLATSRRPRLRTTLATLVAAGLLLMLLRFHRQELYLGSDEHLRETTVQELLMPTEDARGDPGIFSLGLITACRVNSHYYWGKGFFVQLIVRAIPKQVWPTKYEDVGMDWMVRSPGFAGMTEKQWLTAVGWIPNMGSAAGFVSDAFVQFAWGGVVVCYLFGLLYGALWKNSLTIKGLWIILYFEAAVVSVYVPTQGLISAWAYRFLYLAVPSVILWYFVRGRQSQSHSPAHRLAP